MYRSPPPCRHPQAMVVEETPTARQGTNRFNLLPVPAIMTRKDYTRRFQQTKQVLLDEARGEVDSLRTQLSSTQRLNVELQSLLEVDQEAHPFNKKTIRARYSTTLSCDQGE